jgi:hypothetical protein
MARVKRKKESEFARWKYRLKIDVEETKSNAENRGFSCRLHEGQPKNKKGKNDWGEGYPLPQYEITGSEFPAHIKINIAPKTTQIFFFGLELIKPAHFTLGELEPFTDRIRTISDDLGKAEKIMNELASFEDNERGRFGQESRVYVRVPAMYRLLMTLRDATQELSDNIMSKFQNEVIKALDEMLQGNMPMARKRMDELFNEMVFFQRSLIATAKELKDPQAEQWEANLNKMLMEPLWIPKLSLDSYLLGQ